MGPNFAAKSVLITGASSGLGAAMAQAFAAAGAHLTLMGTNSERLEAVVEQCRAQGAQALAVVGDVTRPDDCKRLVYTAHSQFAAVDYLVANAGVSMWTRFEDVSDLAVFRKLIEVNYLGVVNCVHHALPHLRQSRGLIVAVSSIQGQIGVPLHTGYGAAKHALEGFCNALRLELEGSGVDILTVLPHWLKGTQLRRQAFGSDGQPLGEASRRHSSQAVPVENAAQAVLKAAARRRRRLVIPWKLNLLLFVYNLRAQWAEAVVKRAMNKENH
ncbi:MAG: SDR family oxidoreductase [Candidatus Latescibacteria bacterium]|nr:SDR family oxidoreductase [Candidatus Latescibacterota bacterium]